MKHFAVALSIFALTPSAFAAGKSCSALLTGTRSGVAPADIAAQLKTNYESPSIEMYRALERLLSANPTQERGNRDLIRSIEDLARDEELAVPQALMKRVVELAARTLTETPGAKLRPTLQAAMARLVSERLPIADAEARAQLLAGRLDKESLVRALGGDVTLAEANTALVGSRGIHDVSPESLVGRFLEAARELNVNTQSTVGTFRVKKRGAADNGPERLFIPIDHRTRALAVQFFGSNPNFILHDHSPGQNTLALRHDGQPITYARYDGVNNYNGMARNVDSILPIVALSGLEASRAANYFSLGKLSNTARSKYPWSLVTKDQKPEYCRKGGYTSCTHWVGEMPIGEKLVDEYVFPGQWDRHADQADAREGETRKDLRAAPVGTYDSFTKGYGAAEAVGETTRVDRLTRMVWKQRVGSQQFWDMLGLRDQLRQGELANPGWVLFSLLARARQDRVSVVLVMTNDASVPLTQKAIDRLRSTINAY